MPPKKKNLSKYVLDMKFMQRTKASEDLKRFEDEGRAFFQDANANLAADDKESNLVVQHNWYLAENLTLGRFSFNGMNSKIEEIMKSYCNFGPKEELANDEFDVDVTAKQFARHIKRNKQKRKNVRDYLEYEVDASNNDSSLIQTIASKFQKIKNKRKIEETDGGEQSNTKLKFLKPDPDD